MKLYLDLETYSEVPIKHGTHAYAEKAEILLIAYACDEEPVKVFEPGWQIGQPGAICEIGKYITATEVDFRKAFSFADKIIAHNSHFDRTLMRKCFYAAEHRHLEVARWHDTMVRALAHSLPGSLDTLCEIYKLPMDKAKAKEGKALIQLFCKPQPANRKLRRATRETHPAEWAKFIEYARLDVEAMRELDKLLPAWNLDEKSCSLRQEWLLDQKINDRGWLADVELAEAAVRQEKRAQDKLDARTAEITEDEVSTPRKRDKILKFILAAYGVDLPDMQGSTLERRITDPDLPSGLRELLAVRLQSSTTSVSKYKALLRCVSSDHRVRNSLKFCGAGRTGRWSGQLFQPHNLARPDMKAEEIEYGIAALKSDCADLVLA